MRAVAQALSLKDTSAPKNIGEGLTAIGNALAYRSMMDDITKASDAGTASASNAMQSLFSGGTPPAPAAPAMPQPQSIPPEAMGGAPMSDTPAPLSGGTVAPPQAPQATNAGGPMPRGLRNNNPLNIEAGSFTQGKPGFVGSDGRFAQFSSMDQGIAAADALLQSYAGRGINTIGGIVNRWAPPKDNNPTTAYAATVARSIGVDPNQPIDMSDPALRQKIIGAMAQFENGRPLPQVASADPNFMPSMGGPQIPPQPLVAPDQPIQMAQAGGFVPQTGPEPNVTMLRTQPVQPTIGQQPAAQPQTPQAGPSPTVQQLMQAVQNPWLSAGQQAVVKSMLEQKLKEQDPTHQVDLQLKQAQLKNATGAPESVRALQERARLAGLQPGTLAYNQFMATGGASRQTIAPPEKGMRYVYDQNGNVVSEEPVPGGSVARAEAEKEAAKKLSGNLVMQDIDRAMGMADGWTTGPGGALLQNTPGSSAHDMQQLLQGVKANVGFDRLQQMRSQSPTGGALGQVSEQENRLLQSTMGSLEQSQTKAQFLENLGRLKSIYVDIVHGTPTQRAEMVRQGKLTEAENAAIEAMKTARIPAAQQGAPPKAGNYKYNPATGKLEPVQ